MTGTSPPDWRAAWSSVVPAGHDAPKLSAAVLAPADGAVVTATLPLTVNVLPGKALYRLVLHPR